MKKIIILSLLFGLTTNIAYAQLGATLESAAEVDTNIEEVVNTTVEAVSDVEVDAGASANSNTSDNNSNTSIKADASLKTDASTNSESANEEEMQAEAKTNTNMEVSGLSFSIQASSAVDTSIENSSQVSNETELQSYASVVVNKNESVEKVEANQNALTVTYKSKAKLFGFIPLTVKNKAEVTLNESASGSVESKVKVKFPWYKFLLKTETKAQDTETEIKSKIDGAVKAHATVTAQTHAKALGVVEANVEANATAQVN